MGGTISSTTDVHKFQRHNLGDLPEGILLHILSFLPTKDAVRTSILAKKWRYLWTYLSAFDFEKSRRLNDLGYENLKNKANRLLDIVGRLLHKSNRIERLSVIIYQIFVDTDKVTSLISFAAKHKIQYLKLSVDNTNDNFVLPHSFSAFKSLNELHLGLNLILHIPTGINFPSMKKLVVSDVTFANENSVQQLFSGCPVLQELELHDCFWHNMDQIYVAISTLRKLRIGMFYNIGMTVKIDVVNLLSFSCTSRPDNQFILVNLTSLVDACIDVNNRFGEPIFDPSATDLLRGVSSVKSLRLYDNTLEYLYHTKDTLHLLPTFYNLTHLYVFSMRPTNTNEVLMDILRKTPKLEALTIPGVVLNYLDGEDLIPNSVPCCFKSSLNQLCISNFDGDEYEIQFVKFVLNNAPYLGEIKIHCSRDLSADMEKLDDIWNQLEDECKESCVIRFWQNLE